MMAEPGNASSASRVDDLFARAMHAHQEGRLDEAEAIYRDILTIDPRQLDSLHLLGAIALQRGDPAAAVTSIGQAIAANDRIAAYHSTIATAYRALQERDKAIEHCRKAIALDPRDWSAHSHLSDMLREAGDRDGSDRHFAQAVALNPEAAERLCQQAVVHLTHGRPNEALEAVSRALAVRDDPAAHALFAQAAKSATVFPPVPAFRAMMIRALREPWARPLELAAVAAAMIKREPTVAAAIERAMASWPRRLSPQECAPVLGVLALDELLHALMDTTPINDGALERLLTSIRAILLDAALNANSDVSPQMAGFASSLARQCFIAEYVFDVTEIEERELRWLRNSVKTALAGRAPVLSIRVLALASYAPLHALDRDEGLFARTWPPGLSALITEQVREPRVEAALAADIPRLTDIADAVSLEVRQQYEQNPYPRWIKVAPTAPEANIAAYLRAVLPHPPLRETSQPDVPEILIAGCGTGQQSIGAALRYPKAHVLAIDLSLTSLCYAKRKSDAAGVPIEYAQADIVEFKPGRSFDLIESSGVLHHLADPLRGWSALLALLKPGGFMRLGLYSERARAGVVAIREFIAQRGYAASPDDIRRCRQDLITAQDPRFTSILHTPDFYSMSGCRDLLFHVQEHRLTLPQIGAFLNEQGLTLLGFELGAVQLAAYRARFPEDAAMTDLSLWHRFEEENPATFAGMYNFWVQKAA